MSNDNQVKLEIDLDLKDSALRDAERKLNELGKKVESSLAAKKGAGGQHTSAFFYADQALKKDLKNFATGKSELLKHQQDYENKSRPITKRVAGVLHKWMYGEKVTSGEDADKEHRRMEARMGTFQRKLHSTLALSAHLAGTLAPLPGGGALHAGLSGFAGGFADGAIDPNTGRQKKGLAGAAGALWGGLKGGGAAAGLMLLAKGVAGAVEGGREEEGLTKLLGRGIGGGKEGVGLRNRLLGLTGVSGYGMGKGERGSMLAQSLQAGLGFDASQQALRAQTSMGMGGMANQLFGQMQRMPGSGELGAGQSKAAFIDMLAAGYDKSLKRINPRLVTEGLASAMQMMGRLAPGVGLAGNSTSEVFKTQRWLDPKFKGKSGEVMATLDEAMKGNTSDLAQGIALMANGLGDGKSWVQAKLGAEVGAFGKDGSLDAKGLEAIKARAKMTAGFFGGMGEPGEAIPDNAIAGYAASLGTPNELSTAKSILELVKSDAGIEDFKEARGKAMTAEQKAWEQLGKLDWDEIEVQLKAIASKLAGIFNALGGTAGIATVLQGTLTALQGIAAFISDVKTKGWKAAVEGELPDKPHKTTVVSTPDGWEPVDFDRLVGPAQMAPQDEWRRAFARSPMGDLTGPAEAEAQRMAKGAAAGTHVEERIYRDQKQTLHFVLDLVDNDGGAVLERREAVAVKGAGPAQFKLVKAP